MQSYQTFDDETLLSLISGSDERAFTELYNRYWERMVTVAYAKLGSGDDAKEVVQEVFINLWNRRQNLDIQHVTAYLSGAVKYKVLTLLAARKKETAQFRMLGFADFSNTTEEWLQYNELRANLENAVMELPEKCKIVFQLSRQAGMSTKQIAAHLDVSPKTVENHLTRALSYLKKVLTTFLLFM